MDKNFCSIGIGWSIEAGPEGPFFIGDLPSLTALVKPRVYAAMLR